MAHRGTFRGGRAFDAPLVMAQILCLQACTYLVASVFMVVAEFLAAAPRYADLDHLLLHSLYRLDTVLGCALSLAWIAATAFSSFFLLWIVGRARLCLDFVVTLHILHLCATYVHSNHTIPTELVWWLLQFTSCAFMVRGGQTLCERWELEPIVLGGGSVLASSGDQGFQVNMQNRRRRQHNRWKRKTSIFLPDDSEEGESRQALSPQPDPSPSQDIELDVIVTDSTHKAVDDVQQQQQQQQQQQATTVLVNRSPSTSLRQPL